MTTRPLTHRKFMNPLIFATPEPARGPRNYFSVNFHQAAASEVAELPFQVEIHLTGHPLFVAFGEQSGNKAQARSGVGEDRSDAGSALQFSVNSFEAIRCS